MSKSKSQQYVLVTTAHRGVFAGLLAEDRGEVVVIESARNCVYWSQDAKGFLGLASSGPTKYCRVGPAVPRLTLRSVTSISECTPEARSAWEAGPWRA